MLQFQLFTLNFPSYHNLRDPYQQLQREKYLLAVTSCCFKFHECVKRGPSLLRLKQGSLSLFRKLWYYSLQRSQSLDCHHPCSGKAETAPKQPARKKEVRRKRRKGLYREVQDIPLLEKVSTSTKHWLVREYKVVCSPFPPLDTYLKQRKPSQDLHI